MKLPSRETIQRASLLAVFVAFVGWSAFKSGGPSDPASDAPHGPWDKDRTESRGPGAPPSTYEIGILQHGYWTESNIDTACAEHLSASLRSTGIAITGPRVLPSLDAASSPSVLITDAQRLLGHFQMTDGVGGGAVEETAVFSGPKHFANFLASTAYREIVDGTICALCEFWNVRRKVVGLAYAGTAHIFTSDRPIVEPADLRGRTGLMLFDVASLFRHAKQVGFGFDPVLGFTATNTIAHEKAIAEAIKKYSAEKLFIVMPTLLARQLIPPEMRRYVSTARSGISITALVAQWKGAPSAAEEARLEAAVQPAVSACSKAYFDREAAELTALRSEGSTIVPSNWSAFRALTRRDLGAQAASAKPDQQEWHRSRSEMFDRIVALDSP